MLKAIFFDCDGTLLDTIEDIKGALNGALKLSGLDLAYERKDVLTFIGNGADTLLHRSLGKFDTKENFITLKKNYLPLYEASQKDNKAFDGVNEALSYLQSKYQLFVVTNKPDFLAKIVVKQVFPDIHFEAVEGQRDDIPPKPDPTMVKNLMNEYGLKPDECIYVGDALPDVQTGHNAGLQVGLCLFGYGKYDEELLSSAELKFETPRDWMRL